MAGFLEAIRRRLGSSSQSSVDALDRRIEEIERRVGRVDKKIDAIARHGADDRLLMKRLETLLDQPRRRRRRQRLATTPSIVDVPSLQPPADEDWVVLDRCPACDHSTRTLVCEYNRFLLHADPPPGDGAVYNYSLCHACGIVFAARRPTGRRFQALLAAFSENLGRAGRATLLLNPRPLTPEDRHDLVRRTARGVFVSEHDGARRRDWIPGVLRDRMSAAVHVELLGSLVDLRGARVLEIRSRTGALSASLQRVYGCRVETLPMFEIQQCVIQTMYGLPADGRIDFEDFTLPYDGAYDVIVSNHMLTHAIWPGRFLRTLHARLRPGGRLYVYNEPDEAEFIDHQQSMFNVLNPFHLQTFDRASLLRALGAAGFETVFVTHTDQNFVCLSLRADAPASPAMGDDERARRLAAYRGARDFAILALPENRRPVFAAEWDAVVERAVRAGQATIDERGRLIFGRKLAETATPDAH